MGTLKPWSRFANLWDSLTSKGKDLTWFLTLQALLGAGSWAAMSGFKTSTTFVDISNNPTPFGYTKSLVLFLLPCAVFGLWLLKWLDAPRRKRAFTLTVLGLAPVGALLDIFFGHAFLTFVNRGSVLGGRWPSFYMWGYDISTGWKGLWGGGWSRFLPIEEFLFYFFGFAMVLLTYIWADEVIFGASKVSLEQPTPRLFKGWMRTVGFWIGMGAILFSVAYEIRVYVPPEGTSAFPGYFLFLLLTAIVPSMICSRFAFHFVNWRALTIAWLFVLAISQFWEACLAIPYQWWGYRNDQMMGIFLKPACDLPLEAVLLWSLVTWTTVMVYETIYNRLRLKAVRPDRSIRNVLGARDEDLKLLKAHPH